MAQFASGEAPRILIPRGTTSTPMPPARPPPPTGTTMACTSGSCARISRASRPPLPAMTWSSSNAETKTRPGSAAARPARLGLGLVVGGAGDLDLGAQRGDAGALELGRLRRDQDRRLDAEGARGERDAEAVVAGRSGDHPAARPRLEGQRRDARRGAAQLERARPLQVLQLQPDVGARPPPQRRRRDERRHARQPADAFGDLAARHLPPDLRIEHPLHRPRRTYHPR